MDRLQTFHELAQAGKLSPEDAAWYNRDLQKYLKEIPKDHPERAQCVWEWFQKDVFPLLSPGDAGIRWTALNRCLFAKSLRGFLPFLLDQVLPYLEARDWGRGEIRIEGKPRRLPCNAERVATAGDRRIKAAPEGMRVEEDSPNGKLLVRWEAFLEELRRRLPDSAWTSLHLARVRILLGRMEQARQSLANFLERKPRDFGPGRCWATPGPRVLMSG